MQKYIFLLILIFLWDSHHNKNIFTFKWTLHLKLKHLSLWHNRNVVILFYVIAFDRTTMCWRYGSTRALAGRTLTAPSATPSSSSTSSEKRACAERDPSSSTMGRVSFYLQKRLHQWLIQRSVSFLTASVQVWRDECWFTLFTNHPG